METRHTQSDSSRFLPFAIGLACGAAFGAAMGLLYAPKSGVELRGDIAEGADKIRRRASETVSRFGNRATEMYEHATDSVGDVVDRGREAMDAGREAFQNVKRAVKHNGSGKEA